MANITTQKQAEELQARFNFQGAPKGFGELLRLDRDSIEFKQQVDYTIAAQSAVVQRAAQALESVFDKQIRENLQYASSGFSRTTPEDVHQAIDSITLQLKSERHIYAQLSDLYDGWTRFYLVLNAGGHVHFTQGCSTCYVTTQFGWLPLLSGSPSDDLIQHFGTSICTVCFPDAPTDPRWKDAEAAEAKAPEGQCEGSGEYVGYPKNSSSGAKYFKCEHCGDYVSRTSNGRSPKHLTPAHKAAQADTKRIAKNLAAGRCDASGADWGEGFAETRTTCDCGKAVKITSTGKVPAHKAPKA